MTLHFSLETSFKVILCHLRWGFFFHLGGDRGQTLCFSLGLEEGVSLSNKYFLCHAEAETIDYILIFCSKTKIS